MYEYYRYNDMFCVVGETYSFESEDDMEFFMHGAGVEVETPSEVSDDMLVW